MAPSRKPSSTARPIIARVGLLLIVVVAIEWYLFLLSPAFVLLPSRNLRIRRIYRNYLSTLQLIFFGLIAFVFELVYSIKISIFSGTELLERYLERPFVIANHRTRLDWFFVVCVCLRLRRLSSLKIALKKDVSTVPVFGWAVQAFLFPRLTRTNKEHDLAQIRRCIQYHHMLGLVTSANASDCTLVLFPEGTDLSEKNLTQSQLHQQRIKTNTTKYVLEPKVAGFETALEVLKECNAVDALVDLTFGMVDFAPGERPGEEIFWTGRFPKEVQVKMDVIDWRDLPSREEGGQFVKNSFRQKEQLLSEFYKPLLMYSEQSSANEGTNSLSLTDRDGNQSECSSTQLSNLEPVLQFVDPTTTEPLDETLTKDIRFVQYAMNSFVIVVFLALMIHVAICFAVFSWPAQVLGYAASMLVLGFIVTHLFGGFDRLEMDIFRPDFPDSSEHMYAKLMSQRATRRARENSVWASLVRSLGLTGSTARRSAYIDTVRHRAGLTKPK